MVASTGIGKRAPVKRNTLTGADLQVLADRICDYVRVNGARRAGEIRRSLGLYEGSFGRAVAVAMRDGRLVRSGKAGATQYEYVGGPREGTPR